MAQIKFISGDGVEHEVEETSAAADIMRKNGFQRIYSEEEAAEQAEVDNPPTKDLSKMNRTELIEEAATFGIVIDPADKSQTKAVITAAILAADAD